MIAATGIGIVIVAGSWWGIERRKAREREISVTTAVHASSHAPAGVRIKVEVLNASTVRGLARRATMHLRDRGFDVVAVGTSRDRRDSTLVLDRSGHPDWATLVGNAMGGAEVELRPDSSRYLDITVLIGASWRPPAEPFYP
ncbi:MAG: LytR C-terminal domain-containing protein [Gemmatimonadaceae bacterium]|nr:LytR C-terminal domain-containing protein [Gemmatimonadaceae bacterium]MDQ3520125.1 LytR C-terminal domain-containing protein [Gemmatimonadota bacterium]